MVLPYASALEGLTLDPPEKPTGLTKAVCALNAPPYEAPTWLIQDLWPLGLAGLIVGDGGTFKSSLALHMACAIAGGEKVFDKYETKRAPVLVISAEDDAGTTRMRSEAFVAGHGWDRQACLENLHILADEGVNLASPAWPNHIRQEVERINPGFIILDPWADLLGDGDENSNSDVRPMVKWVRSLMADGQRSVAIVHHMGKGGPDKRAYDRIRGASSLPSASRVIFFLEWAGPVVTMTNLKMSRGQMVPKFVIQREIVSYRDNKLHWSHAKLAVADITAYRASTAEAWVLRQVAAHPGVSTRGMKQLRQRGDPRYDVIQAAITGLKKGGFLAETDGKRGAKLLSLTASGEYIIRPKAGDIGQNDDRDLDSVHGRARSEDDPAAGESTVHDRARSVHVHGRNEQGPGRVSVTPLKGGVTGHTRPSGAPLAVHGQNEPNDDVLDLLLEREGMQEDSE